MSLSPTSWDNYNRGAMSQQNTGGWGGLLGAVASPLIDKLTGADRRGVVEESVRYSRINGSGPNDPQGALKAPTNIWEYILGRQTASPTDNAAAKPAAAAAPSWPIILSAVALAGVVYILFKKT